MTPLDVITDRSIDRAVQWAARIAICRHVRGAGEIGPRWRRGSNSFRPTPYRYMLTGTFDPCPMCGADGGELIADTGHEYCPACGGEWLIGDYDWTRLGDVLRYMADRAKGQTGEPTDPCIVEGVDVNTSAGLRWLIEESERRRTLREADQPPIEWDVRLQDQLARLREAIAAMEAGKALEPLSEGASANAERIWLRMSEKARWRAWGEA